MSLSLFSDWYEGNTEIKSFMREDGQPAFQVSHVCKVLGYANSVDALMYHTDEDERFKVDIGKTEDVWFVTESGLYGLVFGSQKPIAKEFKRWLRREILPKLRRGETALVSTPQQAINLALPNTHPTDQYGLIDRDSKLQNAYNLNTVHQVIPYALGGIFRQPCIPASGVKRFTDEIRNNPKSSDYPLFLEQLHKVVFKKVMQHLIYGHDYFWSEDTQEWLVMHHGLEYLIAFARQKEPLNLNVIGTSHVLLNFNRFGIYSNSTGNKFLPTVKTVQLPYAENKEKFALSLGLSAAMKCGIAEEWYPISKAGIDALYEANITPQRYDQPHCAMEWKNTTQLVSTLDTNRYAYLPSVNFESRAIEFVGKFHKIQENHPYIVEQNPHSRYLYRLVSKSKILKLL